MGGYFSKRRLKRQKRTGSAIGKMQAQWEEDRREQLERAEKRIHVRRRRLNDAATSVQSLRRRQLGQREANRRRAEREAERQEGLHAAARRIQEHWRQRGITKWVKLFSLVAQVIQPVQRGSAARHRHLLEPLYLDLRPSCAVGPARPTDRSWPHSVRPCGKFRHWARAARVVQRYWHGMLGRRRAWAARCERSALWLQCVVRTIGPRDELVWRRRHHAATVIQANIRRHWQQLGGWHPLSVPAFGRHAGLSRRVARSGIQGLWHGYWYRTTRRRAFARDKKTLMDVLARVGLMRHKNWLISRELSLDELSEVHGEWQLGGSPDSTSPYPALVGGWGLNPSSDRMLLLNACRSERHKWLKMKKALAMGAGFSRLHKDQAVTLVQAMFRGSMCRRKMRRAALRDAPLIQRVLVAAHLSRLWPKLRKLGVTWSRLRGLGEAQLGGHVKLAWRSHAIPWGLTPSDATRLAELLRRCVTDGDDAVLVAATQRYEGHSLSIKRAEQARVAALAAVQQLSREAIAERKALRDSHLEEKEHERSKELAARLAVAEASAAREEAVAAAAAAMASRKEEEMYRAMALLDEVYGESWRAVAKEDIPSLDAEKWRSALRESMDLAANLGTAENNGEMLGEECVAAARALGLCQEHVDGLALKLSKKLRKQLPPLLSQAQGRAQTLDAGGSFPDSSGGSTSTSLSGAESQAKLSLYAPDLNQAEALLTKHSPTVAVAERRQVRALRRALRALPPLSPVKSKSGDTTEISRLLTELDLSPSKDLADVSSTSSSIPRLELPLAPLLLQDMGDRPSNSRHAALGVLEAFQAPAGPDADTAAAPEWGLGGPRVRSAAPSKFAPASGGPGSLLPHAVLVRQAKATVELPLAGMPPMDLSSSAERWQVEMARPLTPLVTPPSSSSALGWARQQDPQDQQQGEAVLGGGSSSSDNTAAAEVDLSEFTGSLEERMRQREVKERRKALAAEGTIPSDSDGSGGRDGSSWAEREAAVLLQEWHARQARMLRFQVSDLRSERPRNPKMELRFMVTQLVGWLLRGESKESVVLLMREWVQQQVDEEAAELLRDEEREAYRLLKQGHPDNWYDPGLQVAEAARIHDYEERTRLEMESSFGF
jgi:hypothetical protein